MKIKVVFYLDKRETAENLFHLKQRMPIGFCKGKMIEALVTERQYDIKLDQMWI